ncbi:MAG: GNAT family N-acetyltransferase, partial [Hyphomicrobiales bacterium]
MTSVAVRQAREDDAAFIFDMVRMLADHIGERHLLTATVEDIRRDGFGPDRHYDSLIALADDEPVGLAVYFSTYSTYSGAPCLFVNDLIV